MPHAPMPNRHAAGATSVAGTSAHSSATVAAASAAVAHGRARAHALSRGLAGLAEADAA